MVRREVTPRHAAQEMRTWLATGEPSGIMFGPERTGLVNDDVALADTVLTVPLNPGFSSLNLAQAVLIVGYEWFTSGASAPPEILRRGGSRPATKAELLNFFEHLEEELVRNGFLRNRESRPSMVRNLRSVFQRAQCTEQELRTLHGVVTSFAGPRRRKEKAEEIAER
jgi:tRNA/rRNA methyltransferase